MLKNILKTLLTQRVAHTRELAQQLGVQPSALEDMLQLLVRRGLLRLGDCDTPADDPHCSGCPAHAGCATTSDSGRAYYVTDKGKRYAES
jgi:hypothetical protein